jgi:cation diffusion facilitator family transporter
MDKESYEGAKRVLWITLFLNVVVVLFKLIFGIMISSLAMIADGLHSLLDGASNVVCLVGLRISAKPADRSHPYGHRKFETLTTIIIAMFLLLASLELLRKSLERFRGAVTPQITMGAFAVLVLTLAVNIFVSYYERKKGEQYGSRVLIADSLHTSSDVWVTISVIIGFVVIKAGYPFVDPVLAIVIAVVIGYSGIGIIRDTTTVLA